MKRRIRTAVIGLASGAIAGIVLAFSFGHPCAGILLGVIIGVAYAFGFERIPLACVDAIMAAGSLGIPLWGLVSVVAVPLLSGQKPEWDSEQMRSHLPALVAWVLFGALLGALNKAFSDLAEKLFGLPPLEFQKDAKRIVILGGGFAGMKTAQCLERELQTNGSASITLVSDTNALLFTPMLAEVAGSTLEPSHISTPLRSSLHRTEFIRGRVTGIDFENRKVILAGLPGDGDGRAEISYDHLVLALGAAPNYLGMSNVEKLAFNFKSLLDAIRIRNHVIEMFERADREQDSSVRQALLTFVIAGGGFAGVELAGALNDFARGILADYPRLSSSELSIVLVHARDRILPELNESLARYAQEKMEERGVKFLLDVRLADAEPGRVLLSDGEISAHTLVWTAGTAPNPLLRSLALETDKRGAVKVDSSLAVPGRPGVWALGDCASITDAKTGKPCPPTAQFAIREAATAARNIARALSGRKATKFHFNSLGSLCVVGHQTACAELSLPFFHGKSIRFSGLLAWLMWRGIYVAKLPGVERKIRVLMDWTIELFFPRDIVQTIDL